MLELKSRLAAELPPLEAALQAATESLPAPVRPVAAHIFAAGGKRLRPFLTVLLARLLGHAGQDIYSLAISMEMLHAATLLHDDVLDEAHTRRGQPAAHTLFGVAPTILAGDAILAAANQLVAQHHDWRLTSCFSEATARTAAGEILEIEYLRRLDQPAEIYDAIVLGKTAWLLRASCELGALKAGTSPELAAYAARYGERLGMAFQMVDDALDFAPSEATGKPSGGDLREGKLTPPVRLYRESLLGEARKAFDAAFRDGAFTEEDAARVGGEIRRLGFDAATRRMAGTYLEEALEALEHLPQGPERRVLRQMADYIQNREK